VSLHIEIEPLDTVFFRDNRPFDAGIDTVAETILPSPLTLFGVIGSYYLNVKEISLQNFKRNMGMRNLARMIRHLALQMPNLISLELN